LIGSSFVEKKEKIYVRSNVYHLTKNYSC